MCYKYPKIIKNLFSIWNQMSQHLIEGNVYGIRGTSVYIALKVLQTSVGTC